MVKKRSSSVMSPPSTAVNDNTCSLKGTEVLPLSMTPPQMAGFTGYTLRTLQNHRWKPLFFGRESYEGKDLVIEHIYLGGVYTCFCFRFCHSMTCVVCADDFF